MNGVVIFFGKQVQFVQMCNLTVGALISPDEPFGHKSEAHRDSIKVSGAPAKSELYSRINDLQMSFILLPLSMGLDGASFYGGMVHEAKEDATVSPSPPGSMSL